jgi:hypothetical protein
MFAKAFQATLGVLVALSLWSIMATVVAVIVVELVKGATL